MKPEYTDWIAAEVPTNPRGLCRGMVEAMVLAFPELRAVRGHYCLMKGRHSHREDPTEQGVGRETHWWCVTMTGEIVDPTVAQFRPGGTYEPWPEGAQEPIGKCPDCGALVFTERYSGCCTPECQRRYDAYMKSF